MAALVLAGFGVALAAPLLHRLAGRVTPWLLAAYPAAGFLLLVRGQFDATDRFAWAPALGVELSFLFDGLSRLFALLITGVGVLVVLYASEYLAGHPRLGRFYAYLLGFMASMLGLVLADNLLALFLFWELTSITSFLLIGFEQDRAEARAAALQALYVTAGGGLAMLAGLLLLADAGGSYELSTLTGAGDLVRAHDLYAPILLLLLVGAFTKSAQAPFHFWLPNAMEAPTPVSAYLHSSTMVKAGVYLLARLHPALGGTTMWLALVGGIGAATAVLGAALAWRQTDLKRILAYSTVSALGMMTMLIGLGTDLTLKAAVLLVLAHALYKGALFLVAGAVAHGTGERHVGRLGALRARMPLTMAAAVLAALSMAGVPPFGGFLAKELMLEAALHAPGVGLAAAGVLLVTSVLLGAVAFLVGFRPFFGAPTEATAHAHEGGVRLWAGAMTLALLGALAGAIPTLFADPIVRGAAIAAGAAPPVSTLVLWHGLTPPLWMGIAAIGAALLMARRWKTPAEPPGGVPARTGLAERTYGWALAGLTRLATWQTRTLQSGYLRYYLLIIVAATALLGGATLIVFEITAPPLDVVQMEPHEAVLLLLVLGSVVAAARSASRLAAVAALGIAGYGVALLYVIYGAPDLAMTQFVIETLTVILFLFAFRRLPAGAFQTGAHWNLRDAVVAGTAGLLMTVLVLAATTARHDPPISHYFVERSVPDAHGRNVVNVILVDFRALDTLGEISVLALAGIGVFALLRLRPDIEVRRR